MAQFHVAALQNSARTASRGPSLVVGTKDILITEVGVESNTAVASPVALRRITAVGTGGTALDEVVNTDDGQAPTATAANSSTADHTLTNGFIRLTNLPAAIGGGPIWTFSPGIQVRGGTGDGIALTLPSGTDANINFHFTWEE